MTGESKQPDPILDFFRFVDAQPTMASTRLLSRILLKFRRMAGAEAGTVFLVSGRGAHRALSAAAVQNDRVRIRLSELRVPIDGGTIAGYVALTGKTLILPDVYHLPADVPFRFNPANEKRGYRTRSMLCFPLLNANDRVIGVVQLINRHVPGVADPVPFDAALADLVVPVASVLGNVVERAALMERITAKNALLAEQNSELAEQRQAIERLQHETEDAFMTSIRLLARAAEIHDEDTGNHIVRVNEYAYYLACVLGMPQAFCNEIRYSAQLHDVGKMSVDAAILHKRGPLTAEERAEMNRHPLYGWQILSVSPRLAMAAEIALCHHEKWDGTGYPNNKKGEEIPLSARITQFADIYDALRAERPYKPAFDHDRAVAILTVGDDRIDPKGHFDPSLIEAFRTHHEHFDRIWRDLAD